MKGLFTAVALLFFLVACKESGVQLSKPSTFVRYFSDGNQDEAIDILETSDHGLLVLSHSESSGGFGGINITKTDLGGNIIWEKFFRKDSCDLRPSNFVALKDNSGNDQGYAIVGTVKNFNKYSRFGARLYILRINNVGDTTDSRSYYTPQFGNAASFRSGLGQYVIGKGIVQASNSTTDLFVIGQVVGPDLATSVPTVNGKGGDMYFAQMNGGTLDTVFTRIYGGGTSNLASRLYLDYSQTYAYWGGTRTDDQGTHMRFIKSGFNSQQTLFDLSYPVGDNGFTGTDFCTYGYGYAFIGNHTAAQEIAVARVGSGGDMIGSLNTFSLTLPLAGNSICSTQDGGLLLLGTSNVDSQGTNTDYYLIKVDGTGAKQWEMAHGGKYPDVGARVLQSSDGGYIVLGTTTLANVKTVFLMKTDSQGNIE